MRWIQVTLLVAGCMGTTKPADSGHTGSPLTTTPPYSVRYEVWEEDRQCWAIRDVERPGAYWEEWYYNGCRSTYVDYPTALADADGLCARLSINPGCEIIDPFLLPCEAVAGCCDLNAATGGGCFPEFWQP